MHPPGNDVVDLCAEDNRRSASNPRYAQRVLNDHEYARLKESDQSELLLWLLWSAKEAAYKSLSPDGQLVFSQRQFEVHTDRWRSFNKRDGEAHGRVVHRKQEVPVRWRWTPHYVHCVSGVAATDGRASVRPARDIHIDLLRYPRYEAMPVSSQAVRALGHELLADLGTNLDEIWISRRARHAPQIVVAGAVWSDAKISLSHDGRFVAAVLSRWPQRASQRQD